MPKYDMRDASPGPALKVKEPVSALSVGVEMRGANRRAENQLRQ